MDLKSVHSDQYAAFLVIITAARNGLGLSQRALAKLLHKPQSFVSKYERGERRLDVIEFLDLCKVLKLNPSVVLRKLESKDAKENK
ncbi:MAG: helix-turn-helix transcriptional regulator [Blastocatellia bacterium]